jgi:hypothetical protein
MRELLEGAETLTSEQKARSWQAVRAAIDAEPRRVRRRRITLVAVGLTTVAVAGATAAAIVVASRPVTDHHIAECRSYSSDGTSIRGTEVSNATRAGEPGPGSIADAVGACAEFWRAGILRRDLAGIDIPENFDGRLDGSRPVPPLIGCTRDDGAAVVVVGDGPQACRSAGYAPTRN